MSAPTFLPLADVRLEGGPLLAAQQRGRDYLLGLDPDRLLAPYLHEAGLPSAAPAYGNWESSGLDGHTAGHALSALALLAASSGDTTARERANYLVSELRRAQLAGGTGYLGGIPSSDALWRDVAAGVGDDTFRREGRWVPWYNLHKAWTGLLDAHVLLGSTEAMDTLLDATGWWARMAASVDDAAFATMLRTEYGGMNDLYARLFALTRDPAHRAMAERFTEWQLVDALAARRDELSGLHANTQIPKIIGFARLAASTGDERLARAAKFFWETVVTRRSVAIGGNSVREHFHPSDDFSEILSDREGPESCNTVNMVTLSALLFEQTGEPRYLDYLERAQHNHLLSAQHPETGGLVYFTPMRPDHYRVYSSRDESFWCCVGTGLETHARHGSWLAARDGDALIVTGFAPSIAAWPDHGVTIRQITDFPADGTVRLEIGAHVPTDFELRVRRPVWADGAHARLGDETFAQSGDGRWLSLRRCWSSGDVVELVLPMAARLEELPDESGWAAVAHGPRVFAARSSRPVGAILVAGSSRMGHIASGALAPLAETPVLLSSELRAERRADGTTRVLATTTRGPLEFEPFADVHDCRYTLYLPVAGARDTDEWATELARQDAERGGLDARTLDSVAFGEQQPETEHDLTGAAMESGSHEGRRWRSTRSWLALVLRDWRGTARQLRVTWLPGQGTAAGEITVDDVVVARFAHSPGAPAVVEATLPESTDVPRRVRIDTTPGATSGLLADIRLLE